MAKPITTDNPTTATKIRTGDKVLITWDHRYGNRASGDNLRPCRKLPTGQRGLPFAVRVATVTNIRVGEWHPTGGWATRILETTAGPVRDLVPSQRVYLAPADAPDYFLKRAAKLAAESGSATKAASPVA